MTPREKAVILVDRYTDETILYKEIPPDYSFELDKRLALIAVDEMLSNDGWSGSMEEWHRFKIYFEEVKQEIEKL